MDTITRVRRVFHIQNWSMKKIVRELHLSPKTVPYVGPFDGFHGVPAPVSKTCTVRFDNKKYSVLATAVGRPVDVHAYADRIVIRQEGVIVGEHARAFGRNQTVYDPWHYVPVLARKPGGCAMVPRSGTGSCHQP